MTLNGPIAADRPDTAIRAAAFVEDPELGTIETVHGRVRFLQVVGLTVDEYEATQLWNTIGLLDALAPSLPLLVTDVHRASLLGEPSIAARVSAGIAEEGSSTGRLMVGRAGWTQDDGRDRPHLRRPAGAVHRPAAAGAASVRPGARRARRGLRYQVLTVGAAFRGNRRRRAPHRCPGR